MFILIDYYQNLYFQIKLSTEIQLLIQIKRFQQPMKKPSKQNRTLQTLKIQQNSKTRIYPSTQELSLDNQKNSNKYKKIQQDYFQDYQAANYYKSLKYMNQHGYKRKLITGNYEQIQFFCQNSELKQFGIGIYLYLEFFRRIGWCFLLFSIFQAYPIYLNYLGNGLSSYSLSYGTYLIKTTLGNYSVQSTAFDAYFQTGIHCGVNLILFLFFLSWKIHNVSEIQTFENDNKIVHPKKYCVQIQGFPQKNITNQQLQIFFSQFGQVYECSLNYNYDDKLELFKEVEQLDEKIKVQQLEIRLGDGDVSQLQQFKIEKRKLADKINSLKISPRIISAYVHFEYQKSKVNLLDYYNDRYMFSNNLHECAQCVCCCLIDKVDQQKKFHGIQLRIKNDKVPDPAEINWQSIDINLGNKLFRIFIAFVIIIIFLFLCSTLIALCSIFIATNSVSCQGVVIPSYEVAKVSTNSTIITCFCSSNLFSFTDNKIQTLCQSDFQKLYISNGLQLIATIISTFTNFVFGLLINKIIDFTKPTNLSSSNSTKAFILFLFLIINTSLVPLLLFANIYGFKISSYISLIQVIFPNSNYFNISSIIYYSDFTTIWYKNVSPYFTNYITLNIILIWMKFIYYSCSNSRRIVSLEEKQGKTLQKHMNKQITSFQFSIVDQTAELLLIIFLSFMYNAGIPVLIPLAAINIISRYITNKYLILRYSSRIYGLTEDFCQLIINILPFSIIISCMFGIWMLTASQYIYPNIISVKIPNTQNWDQVFILFSRLIYLSFTLLMGLLAIGYLFLYNTLIRFLSWFFNLCYESKQIVDTASKRIVRFSQAINTLNILHSYNIHSNPKYKTTIINLERYLDIV